MQMMLEAGTKQLSAPSPAPSGCFCGCHYATKPLILLGLVAGTTGLEPATSAVTGQRSNQLSYVPTFFSSTYAKSKNPLSIVAVYLFSRFHVFDGI